MKSSIESMLPKLLNFRRERDWEQFHLPKELATAISIEASELQEIFLWWERESPEEVKLDKHRMELIKDEVADILIYLLFLSHDLEIDLAYAVNQKLVKNELKYTKNVFKGRFRVP
jgi:NTP pyrophosphatase (non-canonical NTP hydrolase)